MEGSHALSGVPFLLNGGPRKALEAKRHHTPTPIVSTKATAQASNAKHANAIPRLRGTLRWKPWILH